MHGRASGELKRGRGRFSTLEHLLVSRPLSALRVPLSPLALRSLAARSTVCARLPVF